ncbi:hemerythrin domain-containing protein [Marivibrio halodurans]|uniref:Hemerythrin domain-containing protein n=1 Tax=Marivibrio halodurans TaxID=2039722 RepID=A0A8J7S881_9PROT|nr:hemerythrin domain-containing protein [Marivibrio halodurans]MBP5858669.1 hemerythrin domain-containing protein [Marivibrio halodurans]
MTTQGEPEHHFHRAEIPIPPTLPGARWDDIVEVTQGHHARLLSLCDRLERIADSLPDGIDIAECLGIARILVPALRAAHRFEEDRLFPAVRARLGATPRIEDMLARLSHEHREDEGFAEEVAEVLMEWGLCTGRAEKEATGYMLRGLFGNLRRQVAVERDMLLGPSVGSAAIAPTR